MTKNIMTEVIRIGKCLVKEGGGTKGEGGGEITAKLSNNWQNIPTALPNSVNIVQTCKY